MVDEAPRVLTDTRDELFSRAESLAWRLSANLGIPVQLAVTDNRSTVSSPHRTGASHEYGGARGRSPGTRASRPSRR